METNQVGDLEQEEQANQRKQNSNQQSRLERIVDVAHEFVPERLGMHPYHVMFDFGLLLMGGFAFVFSAVVRQFDVLAFLGAFVFTTLTYELLFLRVKRRVFGIDSRSYLQDLIAYVLPVWIGSAWVLGVDLYVIFDVIGLQLPILLGFTRIGCFLGGCCYGVSSKYGIRYPAKVFEPYEGNCQSFSPGDDPQEQVFPIQLVESVVNFLLFGVLFARILLGGSDGATLALYLLSYSLYRFVADFYRQSSARPNWGAFSEAQIVSAGLAITVAGLWILLMPF